MNILKAILILALFSGAAGWAQTSNGEELDTSKLPPEEWDGAVGEDGRIPELGQYFDYEEGQVNFRVWKNKTRVYFLDEEGLVMDPPFDRVSAKLRIRGDRDPFIRMANRGQYLEGPEFIRPPFLFHTVLRLQHSEGELEDQVFTFMFRQDFIRPAGEG